MLFHDVIFAAVFCAFYPSGKAHDQNWVSQWPSEVCKTPGENLTMHCQTHGSIQKAKCLVHWYIKKNDGKYVSIDKFVQIRGRYSEHQRENHLRQSFTLRSLKRNDTGRFYCNYLCKINGTFEQYYGTGTRLFVLLRTENVTAHKCDSTHSTSNNTNGVEGESSMFFPFPILIVLVSKLVVFLFMTYVALFPPN